MESCLDINWEVYTIETAFQLNNSHLPTIEFYRIIMSIRLPRRFPFLNKAMILHVIQDMLNKFPLLAHRCGELPANTLNHSAEQTTIIKLRFGKAMIT